MIDRALRGPNGKRDSDTGEFLGLWLERSRRDYYTDVSGSYAACGTNQACGIVAVNDRPNTDFLWQRSPQLLYGGGQGLVETAATDYLLPYWMARFYAVLSSRRAVPQIAQYVFSIYQMRGTSRYRTRCW